MGKILGVDYGAVRIGIAISDSEKRIAFTREKINASENIEETYSKNCLYSQC